MLAYRLLEPGDAVAAAELHRRGGALIPGQEAEGAAVLKQLVAAVRANEPDVPLYRLFKAKDGDFAMLEMYPSQAALDAHRKTAHFAAIGAGPGPLLASAPQLELLDGLQQETVLAAVLSTEPSPTCCVGGYCGGASGHAFARRCMSRLLLGAASR